jgi:hypothetical protein
MQLNTCMLFGIGSMSKVSATGHVPLFHLTDIVTCLPAAMFDAQ